MLEFFEYPFNTKQGMTKKSRSMCLFFVVNNSNPVAHLMLIVAVAASRRLSC